MRFDNPRGYRNGWLVMNLRNDTLGVNIDIPPIIQRDLEEYYRLRNQDEDGGLDALTVAAWAASVRAAHKVGWLNGLDVSDLESWKPAKTRFVAEGLADALLEAVTIPKD